eukprot:jgi/Botrbrau1/3362/Bobra.0337s0003.1
MAFEVGLLPCQRDSYLRQIRTKVLRCDERRNTKKSDNSLWELVLADTCLYPEGGGQPCDCGTIDILEESERNGESGQVLDVTRDSEGQVRHVTDREFSVGTEVLVSVDWRRRYDHMQQHTGQHVLSAVVGRVCDADTSSWELHPRSADPWADDHVNIEITLPALSPADLQEIERQCNEAVREAHPVSFIMSDQFDWPEGGARGLPAKPPEGAPPLRLVTIGNLDVNPCGGTHLRSTSELQVVKLVGMERTRGQVRLLFICGDRVLGVLGRCLSNEARLTKLLSCGPGDHEKAVGKALGERSDLQKARKLLSEEVATTLGRSLAAEPGPLHLHHREGADLAFLGLVANAALAEQAGHVFLLTGGTSGKRDRPGEGVFLLAGPSEAVAEASAEVARALGGKGGGRAGRFQGKASHVEKAADVADFLLKVIPQP